ncbi:MAG: phenylalanyl-tRNA synthetase beta subunit [Actinomycetia bacterium]|nr:phenylalanyl-tRNA synthetase beta subunit [Actinomycetes bacterium]
MRAPLSWIRDFTPLDAPVAEIAAALSDLGLEVEGIEQPGREITGVVAAKILVVLPHPNADKLQLADVDFGAGETRVVCGAPNIAAGMIVPFAPSGATLPGGFTLERRKIRGEVSDGMLCSAQELGLGDDHSGILQLDAGTELGADVRTVLGLDDVVFDLSITPNRPDAMGITGIARDLAAHFGLPFDVPEPPPAGAVDDAAARVTVEIDDDVRCPRFVGRIVKVVVGPSPEWLARRLTLAGMRPINNVVDVTNYVMLERNRPLHAFDLAKLAGPGIVVRTGNEGETMVTLDGVERKVGPEDLLICDAERVPLAIAGIMGGGDSEVSGTTTEILLESAYFQPMSISKSSKRLGLRSEASARFERGVDPNGCASGADRAVQLLTEIANGIATPGSVDVYPHPVERPRIRLRTARVNALLGTSLTPAEVVDAIRPLGIDVEGTGDDLVAIAPTFRPDLEREIDLIEEVARRIGLNTIPKTLPSTTAQGGGLTRRQRDRRLVVDALVGAGLSEAVTLSLIAPADVERVGHPLDQVVRSTNPLRAEESLLRPRVLPGLLRAAAANAGHGLPDVALFEVGHIFLPPADDALLADERDHLAVLIAGTVQRSPVEPDRPVDAYDAVDAVRAVFSALDLADVRLVPEAGPGFHPTRSSAVVVDGQPIGHVGEIAPTAAAAFGTGTPVVGAELDLDALLAGSRRDRAFVALSRYPSSSIDLAFVLDDDVSAAAVIATLRGAGGPRLEAVRVFDEFRSEALGPGKRSLAFALRFRASERTLTVEEVGELRRAAIDAVTDTHAAQLRT